MSSSSVEKPESEYEEQIISGKIFYATPYTKTQGVRWPVPRGGPLSFFTTWNMIGSTAITIITLIAIPWLRVWTITQKVAAFTIIPIANATIASILCTAIVSQMLFSFNLKIERPLDEPEEDKKKPLCVSIDFVKSMLSYNFIYHLGPLLFGVLLCIAVAFIPPPSTLLGRSAVFLTSLLYFTVFVVAWLLTPTQVGVSNAASSDLTKIEKPSPNEESDEPVTGLEKIAKIYRDPPGWYMSVVFPGIALLSIVFCSFVLYGAGTTVGFQEF